MKNSNIRKNIHAYIKKVSAVFTHSTSFTKLFIIGLILCFLTEGIGIVPQNITFIIFLLYPIVLFFASFTGKKDFPIQNTWLFLGSTLYLAYLFYISFFSLNMQVSFEFSIFILSLSAVFLLTLKFWEEIEEPFLYSILSLGVLFCIYSFLLPIALNNNLFFFYPLSGYQYVYSLFGSNNHLGEFLVFPMLISFCFYIRQKRKQFLLLFLLYFIFFLFSYSRAGYIGFFIGGFLLSINFWQEFTQKQKRMVIAFFLGVLLFFYLLSSPVLQQFTIKHATQIVPAYGKSTVATREEYILQALKGFFAHRYYGVGVGNFEYVSKMFAETPATWTASSHNLFLDVLVETGTIGFALFVFFTVVLLRAIKKHHVSIYAALLLSWFVMVQFDYIHRMYSYLLLFPLFLAGLVYPLEKNQRNNKEGAQSSFWSGQDNSLNLLTKLLCILLGIFLVIYISSKIFLHQGNYRISRTIYPLQMQAYKENFNQKDISVSKKKELLFVYTRLFSGDYWGFYELGKIHEKEGNMWQAIQNYEKSFWADPFRDLPISERIYDLKIKYEGRREGKKFADRLFRKLNNNSDQQTLSYEYWLFLNKFCQRVYDLHCIYSLR